MSLILYPRDTLHYYWRQMLRTTAVCSVEQQHALSLTIPSIVCAIFPGVYVARCLFFFAYVYKYVQILCLEVNTNWCLELVWIVSSSRHTILYIIGGRFFSMYCMRFWDPSWVSWRQFLLLLSIIIMAPFNHSESVGDWFTSRSVS